MDKIVTFRIRDDETYFKLCRYAEHKDTTVSNLIRDAINIYISSLDKEKETWQRRKQK